MTDPVTLVSDTGGRYWLAVNGYRVPGGPLTRGDLYWLGLLDPDSAELVGTEETCESLLGALERRPEVRLGQAVRNGLRAIERALRSG